jgi:hypothetical protein
VLLSRAPEPPPAAGPSPGAVACTGTPAPSRTGRVPARCRHASCRLAFVFFTARTLLEVSNRA